jgi:hypothetical protein
VLEQMTDDQLLNIYRDANEQAMHAQNERTGFGSSMSREAILAGLKAIAACAWSEGWWAPDESKDEDNPYGPTRGSSAS